MKKKDREYLLSQWKKAVGKSMGWVGRKGEEDQEQSKDLLQISMTPPTEGEKESIKSNSSDLRVKPKTVNTETGTDPILTADEGTATACSRAAGTETDYISTADSSTSTRLGAQAVSTDTEGLETDAANYVSATEEEPKDVDESFSTNTAAEFDDAKENRPDVNHMQVSKAQPTAAKGEGWAASAVVTAALGALAIGCAIGFTLGQKHR
jgi:hypothetical protein